MKFDIQKITWQQIVFFLLIVVLIYFIYNEISKAIKKAKQNKSDEEAAAQLEAESQKPANKPSYPLSNYQNMADTIQQAYEGIGEDEEAIYDVYKRMVTLGDVYELNRAFGSRPYGPFGESQGFVSQWFTTDLDLPQWINKLSASKKTKINGILSKANINYQY